METWNGLKLLRLMYHFKLQYQDVCKGVRISRATVSNLIKEKVSFDIYAHIFTAYKNAVQQSKIALMEEQKKAKIKEIETYYDEMIKHYRAFDD